MNFQNLPRQEKVVKRAFVPKLDYFLFSDYKQIEMRILAYYMAMMGDDSMARVLADPAADLHTESAKGIFRLDREPLDPERQLGKNMNFSMVFNAGTPAVLKYLLAFNQESEDKVPVTYPYAKEILARFHARWPGIQRVKMGIHEVHSSRGYLKTIAGARLHPRSEHAEISAIVQSSAAEIMREGLRRCARGLLDEGMQSHLVSVVHDEFIFDVPHAELIDLAEKVPLWMDSYPFVSEVLPITVDIEVSETNWASKHELIVA